MALGGLSRQLNKLCRLCGGTNAVIHIFDTNGSLTLSAQAMSCAKIQVGLFFPFIHLSRLTLAWLLNDFQIELGDGLPEMVCEKCSHQLNISYLFKLQCEDSDRSFRSLLSDKSNDKSMRTTPKLSITLKLEDESDNEDDKKQMNKIGIEDCMQYTPLMDADDHFSSNDEIFVNCLKRSNSTESNCNVKVESLDENSTRY